MNTKQSITVITMLWAACVFAPGAALAQTRINWIGTTGAERAWDQGDSGGGEGTNWQSPFFQPSRSASEYGSISNGGIALVDHSISVSPTDIRLAEDAGSTGSLVIRNGASIAVQESDFGDGNGAIVNGANATGVGKLTLRDNIGTVQVQQYTQNAASTLVAQLGSSSSFVNPVQVSGQATLAGTLRVERTPGSGFVASSGNMWTLFQGAPVTGTFSTVDVDPALKGNAGQAFVVSTASNAVKVSVEQRLVLQVDRFTGATTLRNPSGHATNISLIGYTLSSATTPLDSSNARWKSFSDDVTTPGWFEANPTANNLSELNPQGSLTMNPGVTHDFGTPFTANTAAPLGTSRVNTSGASLKYQLPNGTQVDALVEQVGRFNDLVLVVNPSTGTSLIQNQSGQSISMIGYTVSSTSGALLPSFSGIGGTWSKANPTVNNLSELNATGTLALGIGGEASLGNVWNTAGLTDLTFSYITPAGTLVPGTVYFGAKATIGVPGDYNGNGIVDAADYVAWRKGGPLQNEVADPGTVSSADYTTWRARFGNTSAGSGSGAGTLLASAVPEPAGGLLAAIALAFALSSFRRGRSNVVSVPQPPCVCGGGH
jgi:hypothetical protein